MKGALILCFSLLSVITVYGNGRQERVKWGAVSSAKAAAAARREAREAAELQASAAAAAANAVEVAAADAADAADTDVEILAPPAAPPQRIPAGETRAVLMREELKPGDPLTLGLILDGGSHADGARPRAVLLNARDERLGAAVFFRLEPENPEAPLLWAAVMAIPSLAGPGSARIKVERGTELLAEIPFTIGGRDFVAEEIALNAGNTALRTEPDPQKTAESEQLWAILNRTGTIVYGGSAFAPPVSITRRTSFFGDRRVYRYSNGKSDTAVHAGIDFGAPRGTPVTACAGGKVALARFRIVTGNSVILEHLPGLYSLYYHLDTIHVAEGDLVDTGALLGESGDTGLATGPHLHWEIRAAGENADPDAFMAAPILDKEAIVRKLLYR
ncbi:MAG: M23 family metallopeptidase [Treponema sp.]|jgi:murein DD-endopeptidase MepM/ murein hydrolase activator NlpD|nr:M23 family metallopeptidase [Treponema sp.]